MTATEQLEQIGFTFSHVYNCSCGSKYKVYKSPNKPGIEARVKFTGEAVRVFKNGKQVGVGSYSTIEKLLLNGAMA